MKAKELRDIAENIKSEKEKNQYKEIIDLCSKMANKGGFTEFFYENIEEGVLSTLQADGFKVEEHDDQRDGYIATISW